MQVRKDTFQCNMVGHKSGRLMFDDTGSGYGFPVASSIRDLLIGDDRKYM